MGLPPAGVAVEAPLRQRGRKTLPGRAQPEFGEIIHRPTPNGLWAHPRADTRVLKRNLVAQNEKKANKCSNKHGGQLSVVS